MNEQNKNNDKKPEQKPTEKPKKKIPMSKEKKFYLYTAVGCAAVLLAIIVIAIALTNTGGVSQEGKKPATNSSSMVDSSVEEDSGDEPVSGLPEGMISPIETVSVGGEFGFYYNKTLNSYYEHQGLDFMAEVGAKVLAVEDGKVESIYKDDLLLGTEIVIDHGNGLKSVYRFVDVAEGLKTGDEVSKGEVIATVSEATGNEYKDGPHLHFEILKNNVNVDPTGYLTLEEK